MTWFKHTPETDAVIRGGYAVNRKVAEIAAELGVTRNVVIGRARRLGLADSSRWVASITEARSPEGRERRSQIMKAMWADPEFRERTISSMRIARMWRRYEGRAA